MADRFAESNDILIRSLKDNAKNKNMQQSANSWINVWTDRILNCQRRVLTPECKKKKQRNKLAAICLKLLYVYYSQVILLVFEKFTRAYLFQIVCEIM